MHVRDLDAFDDTDRGRERERPSGLVGVHVNLERGRIADDEERVAHLLELGLERGGVEVLALDEEDRAVAVARQLLVDRVERERLRLHGCVRYRLAGHREREAARDLDEPRPAGVDDARVAEDVEHLRRARDGVLPTREHGREQVARRHAAVLLPLRFLGHLADHGQHRPLDGALDRAVRGIARAAERAAQTRRRDDVAASGRARP